jgi:NADPH:quinone reductase-like Zn-dependent oxidoreductase
MFADLVRLIEDGDLKPVVAATYPLEQLRGAQEEFLQKRFVGSLVIDVRAST